MFSHQHPYATFLAKVQKPSRYTGGEYGEVAGKSAETRVCLAFPDAYEIGMSHLGTKILYGLLNRFPDIACERVFSPWLDMESELRSRGLPLLSLEGGRTLSEFDIIGFSLQYELNFTGVLNILELGGIPLRSAERGDTCPLIIAGGPIATHGEPLAPFIDAFFMGEAEELLPELCRKASAMRRERVPRLRRLIALASSFPLYVPALYSTSLDPGTGLEVVDKPLYDGVPARVKRVWVKDINRFPFPDDSPLPHAESVFDRMAVEIARGCTEGCRFCQAGIIYRPVRERDPVAVIEALVQGIRKGGYEETSMTSLSTADYSCVTPLIRAAMARLRDEQVSLSVSSLRAYGLTQELLADLARGGITGLTFSPEGGTQRTRDIVNKNVTEEDVIQSAHRVFSHGHKRMKLYFMIGLPGETDEDVLGIAETTAKVFEVGRSYLRSAKVTATVSTFVPKPHTPFQWAAMNSREEVRRKHQLLADHARRLRVDLRPHENAQSQLEGIFARGDRACGELLLRAYRLGCRFDGWNDQLAAGKWDQAIAEATTLHGFDPARYLSALPETARLPWSHLDMGVEESFLLNEYRKAQTIRTSPPCGKPAHELLHPKSVEEALAASSKILVCYHCGVKCDLTAMKADRLFFLRRMNAWSSPQTVPLSIQRQAGVPRPPKPHPVVGTGEVHRYRLRYAKLRAAAFLAHLDLVRHLPRAFRRAGFSLFHSVGFHPKPALSFGPALGLGLPSLGEILDVKLIDDVDPQELLARLRGVSLPGIRFLEAVAMTDADPSMGRVLCESHYLVRGISQEQADEALRRFHSGEPLIAERRERADSRREDLRDPVDIRVSLRDLSRYNPNPGDAEILAWPVSDETWMSFAVRVSTEGSARPMEVLAALWGPDHAATCSLARLGHSARPPKSVDIPPVDPLDLPALRVPAISAD